METPQTEKAPLSLPTDLCVLFIVVKDGTEQKIIVDDDEANEVWQTRRADVLEARKMVLEKRLCFSCMKRLVSIGTSRKNGKRSHKDWNTREFHKKCWKDLFTYDRNIPCY